MIQPVTKDRNNEGEIIMIDMDDVLFIESENGMIVFYTQTDKYYPLVPSLSTYARIVEPLGFEKLDRTNLVNMRKVKSFDAKKGVVYFDIQAITPQATVAFMNLSKLKKNILAWIERNTFPC